jgi:hypothetical protein
MKKQKSSFPIWALLLIPVLSAGILVFLACVGAFGLEIDLKVKPSDFVGVLTTALLAFVLQNLWTKSLKRTDAEKDLIQGHVKDASIAVRSVRACLVQALDQQPISTAVANSLVASFEDCTQEMATLETVIDNSHCSTLIADCWAVTGLVLRYKESITGGNFPNCLLTREDVERSADAQREIAKQLQMLSLGVSAT